MYKTPKGFFFSVVTLSFLIISVISLVFVASNPNKKFKTESNAYQGKPCNTPGYKRCTTVDGFDAVETCINGSFVITDGTQMPNVRCRNGVMVQGCYPGQVKCQAKNAYRCKKNGIDWEYIGKCRQ